MLSEQMTIAYAYAYILRSEYVLHNSTTVSYP